MITLILIFAFSCLVSFIGSLQLGPVNLLVINAVLYSNRRVAFWLALGGIIPEFIYCTLAVYFNSFFESNKIIQTVFQIAFVIVLLIISVVFWTRKNNQIFKKQKYQVNTSLFNFFKGLSIAILNPQLLPFWLFVQVYFNSTNFLQIHSNWHKVSFIFGAGAGAFILLVLLVQIVSEYSEIFLRYLNNKYYFKALSILFIAIAGHQIWLLVNI